MSTLPIKPIIYEKSQGCLSPFNNNHYHTWASCKKDKTGNGDTKEKKVVVTTIAGDGMDGYINGTALSARFDTPVDVAVGADGSLYIADANNNRIRKITFQ